MPVEKRRKREPWQSYGQADRDIASLLLCILQELEERVEEGESFQTTFVATTTFDRFLLPSLAFSIEVANDGAVNLEVRVPHDSRASAPVIIPSGEAFEFTFQKASIATVGLRATSGTISTRITGIY